jgi:hypothetical protein
MFKTMVTILKCLAVSVMAIFIVPYEMIKKSVHGT